MSYPIDSICRNGRIYWAVWSKDVGMWVGKVGGFTTRLPEYDADVLKSEFIFLTKGEAEAFAAELQKEDEPRVKEVNYGETFKNPNTDDVCMIVRYDCGKYQLINERGNRWSDYRYGHNLKSIGEFLHKNKWTKVD